MYDSLWGIGFGVLEFRSANSVPFIARTIVNYYC
jgi:hypothetical protein